MSCSNAPNMNAKRQSSSKFSFSLAAQSTTLRVCSQTSPSGCHSGCCLHPIRLSNSGKQKIQFESTKNLNPFDGRLALKSFTNSSKTLSWGKSTKLSTILIHKSTVSESTIFPFLANSCITLSTFNGSSTNVVESVAFSTPLLKSSTPPHGS